MKKTYGTMSNLPYAFHEQCKRRERSECMCVHSDGFRIGRPLEETLLFFFDDGNLTMHGAPMFTLGTTPMLINTNVPKTFN